VHTHSHKTPTLVESFSALWSCSLRPFVTVLPAFRSLHLLSTFGPSCLGNPRLSCRFFAPAPIILLAFFFFLKKNKTTGLSFLYLLNRWLKIVSLHLDIVWYYFGWVGCRYGLSALKPSSYPLFFFHPLFWSKRLRVIPSTRELGCHHGQSTCSRPNPVYDFEHY
jgi:hypothetical protein